MSLWEDGRSAFQSVSSFAQSATDPGTDPADAPLVQVQFNAAWLRCALGALAQLCQPPAWGQTGSSDASGVLGRATKLLNLFSEASLVMPAQEGVVTLTILAGNAEASTFVTFVPTFASLPVVDVSCDSTDVIVAWSEVTTNGLLVSVMVATALTVDLTVDASWHASV